MRGEQGPWIIAGGVVLAAVIVAVALFAHQSGSVPAAAPAVVSDGDIAATIILGAQIRAEDRVAQSDLRNALVAAKTIYTDNSSYVGETAAVLSSVEPSLTFGTSASTTFDPSVSVMTTPTATDWAAAVMSASGTCWGIKDSSLMGTSYLSELATCTGDAAAAAVGEPSWID